MDTGNCLSGPATLSGYSNIGRWKKWLILGRYLPMYMMMDRLTKIKVSDSVSCVSGLWLIHSLLSSDTLIIIHQTSLLQTDSEAWRRDLYFWIKIDFKYHPTIWTNAAMNLNGGPTDRAILLFVDNSPCSNSRLWVALTDTTSNSWLIWQISLDFIESIKLIVFRKRLWELWELLLVGRKCEQSEGTISADYHHYHIQ